MPSMRWATQLWRSFIDYMMLPKLPNVAQLNPLVTRILGQNAGLSTLQGTNSYLIGFPGYPRILIDTTSAGPRLPIYLNLLEAELRRNLSSISQPPIAAVLLTHWHPDHSSAVESVQDLVRNIHPSSNASSVPVYKYAGGPCLRSLGLYSGPLEPMVDGQTFPVPLPRSLQGDFASGNPSLTVISTPGHAVDHVCFLLRSNGLPLCLFTGDLILGHGSTIVSDLSSYLCSLKKLSSMLGDRLMHKPPIYPAHGEVVNDALAKVTEYLQHRQQRIKETADVLLSQPSGTWVRESSLVKRVYPEVHPGLAQAATNNLRQSLFWLSSHPDFLGSVNASPHLRVYVRSGPHEDRKDPQYLREYVQLAIDESYKSPPVNVPPTVSSDWDWMWCES